jgi:hypothetical protein
MKTLHLGVEMRFDCPHPAAVLLSPETREIQPDVKMHGLTLNPSFGLGAGVRGKGSNHGWTRMDTDGERGEEEMEFFTFGY